AWPTDVLASWSAAFPVDADSSRPRGASGVIRVIDAAHILPHKRMHLQELLHVQYARAATFATARPAFVPRSQEPRCRLISRGHTWRLSEPQTPRAARARSRGPRASRPTTRCRSRRGSG